MTDTDDDRLRWQRQCIRRTKSEIAQLERQSYLLSDLLAARREELAVLVSEAKELYIKGREEKQSG